MVCIPVSVLLMLQRLVMPEKAMARTKININVILRFRPSNFSRSLQTNHSPSRTHQSL
jgi:hypothetical protein